MMKLLIMSLAVLLPIGGWADSGFKHRLLTCTMSGKTAKAIAKNVSYTYDNEVIKQIDDGIQSGYLYLTQAYREGDGKASPQYKVSVRFSSEKGKAKYRERNRFTIEGQQLNFTKRVSLVHQNGVYAFSFAPYERGSKVDAFVVLASADGSGISFNPREQVGSRNTQDFPLYCKRTSSPVEGARAVDWSSATEEAKVADLGLFYQRNYANFARKSRIGTEDKKVKELTPQMVASWEEQLTKYMDEINPLYLNSYGYDEAPEADDLIEGALEGGACGKATAHNFFRIEDFTGQLLGFNVEFACDKEIARYKRKLVARKVFIPAGSKKVSKATMEAAIYSASYGVPSGVFW